MLAAAATSRQPLQLPLPLQCCSGLLCHSRWLVLLLPCMLLLLQVRQLVSWLLLLLQAAGVKHI
jgi:hypothetical protein